MSFFGRHKSWGLDAADNWRERGLCRTNPETFFPLERNDRAAAEAVAICHQCPVLVDCSKLTADLRPTHGVWAATTESQRQHKSLAWNRLLQRAGAL